MYACPLGEQSPSPGDEQAIAQDEMVGFAKYRSSLLLLGWRVPIPNFPVAIWQSLSSGGDEIQMGKRVEA